MTNCTRLIGTTTALLLTAAASADLQYGEALLSAESNCFAGSDHQLLQLVEVDGRQRARPVKVSQISHGRRHGQMWSGSSGQVTTAPSPARCEARRLFLAPF